MTKARHPGTQRARAVLIAVLGLWAGLAGLLAAPGLARGQGGPAFGIRPADEAAGAYFTYVLEPGATRTATAAVTNSGPVQLTLKLYAADAITASGGGTAFAAAGERRTGAAAWVAANQMQITVGPQATVTVPVAIMVPPDARPGDHVAGIVVEAPPKAGGGGNVNAVVTERAGVAVVVHVPGAAIEKLAVGEFCFNQETGSRYFEIPVANQGSLLSTASGTFRLETEKGDHVFDRPVELGSVIPTLETVVRVHAPQDPAPGKYVARLVLAQKDGQEIRRDSKVTIPEKKVNGCKSEASVAGAKARSEDDNFAAQVADGVGGGSSWLVLGLVAALALVTSTLVTVILRSRRRQGRGPEGRSA